MLRALFVLSLTIAGGCLALKGPFHALLYYTWNAYFRPEEWVWGDTRDLILALNASFWAGVLVVLSTFLGRTKFLFNAHIALLLVFAAHAALSAQLSTYSEYSWFFCGDFLRAVVITYLIIVLTNDRWKIRALMLVMVFSLGFEGAKQAWVQLITEPGGRNDNSVAFLGDNNGVAVGMFMLVPLLGALARTTTNRPWLRRLLLFVLVGVLYRGISTYSRGGFLAAGVLAIVYWLRSRNKIAVLAGILVVAGVLLPVMPEVFWERMRTIRTYSEIEEGSALSRLHFWKVAMVMASDNPIFGVGFHAFNPAYNEYDFSFGKYGEGRSVHSSWFGVLAELGYLGAILYGLLLALALRNCHVARKLSAADPDRSDLVAYAISFETSIWVFLVGGSFLPFQYNEMVLHLIGLTIALRYIAARRNTVPDGPASHDLRR